MIHLVPGSFCKISEQSQPKINSLAVQFVGGTCTPSAGYMVCTAKSRSPNPEPHMSHHEALTGTIPSLRPASTFWSQTLRKQVPGKARGRGLINTTDRKRTAWITVETWTRENSSRVHPKLPFSFSPILSHKVLTPTK